jgi:cell division protein FtsB
MAGFAFAGGEYGTRDLWALRRQAQDERTRIAQLRHEIDSLGRLADSLTHDPATQERYAREKYGMIRPGELLYQVARPDSGR